MSTLTIVLLNLGIPALMFLIGAVILLLEFQRWIRKKEGNSLDHLSRDKRRRPPALMVALGLLLIAPASCFIVFFISRGLTSADSRSPGKVNSQLTLHTVDGGIRSTVPRSYNFATWHALERSTLESLDRVKPKSSGFFKGARENARRDALAADIAEAVLSNFTFGLRYEMALLREAPAAYFGRFAPAPALTSARFTLPITPEQMSPLSPFAYTLSVQLYLPENPDDQTPTQLSNIHRWAASLDFPPRTYIQTPAALAPQTQTTLLTFPRIHGLYLRNMTDAAQLKPWEACKELEYLQLEMTPDAKAASWDFTTFPCLTYLWITNPQTSDEILDTCRNVRVLRIDDAPGFKSTTIQRLSTLPNLRWVCLSSLPLDIIPAQDWEKLRTLALTVQGSSLSQEAITLIAKTDTHDNLILKDTPLTIGAADALSRTTSLWHLAIGEPELGALIKLATVTNLRGLDVYTADPARIAAELADLKKKLPNLNIRINPTQDIWSSPW